MQSRDKTRLSVLRTILADITNSSKTSTPITNDILLLNLLKKRSNSVQQSIQQFYEADRKDLVAAEEEQLHVLEEYVGSIKAMTDGEIEIELQKVVESLKSEGVADLKTADVMKRSVAPGGPFDGRIVSKGDIARIVKKVLQK
jgi:uncharacterized protein